ncbi:MAG: fimbrillin family protein [Muribaculaceae bacterium]|jgi:hypothetical protein|nr:fimbrillin family protein [Muribaculaceae bacterium]
MKLFNYLLPGICVMMAGCSSSEIIDDVSKSESSRIGFDTHMNKNSRALDNSNFNSFFVYGSYTVTTSSQPVQVFTGDRVTKGQDGNWTYTNDRYWNPQGTYDFYAYSCENTTVQTGVTGNANLNGRILNLVNYTINQDHARHDLVYATAKDQKRTDPTGTASPVSFAFKHILTRLKFTFKSAIPGESYTVKISNVSISHYRNVGTFLGSTENWQEPTRNPETPSMPLVMSAADGVLQKPGASGPVRTDVSTEAVYMIPFQYQYANVRIEFDFDIQAPDTNGNLMDVMGSHITATWQPNWIKGQSINNVITLTGSATGMDPIRFTASIVPDDGAADDGWVPGTGNANFSFDQSFPGSNS